MTSPHANPEQHGFTFGGAIVTVDLQLGDCVVHVSVEGPVVPIRKQIRLHSIEEMRGAYQVNQNRAAMDPVSADIARAIKFAAQRIKAHEKEARHGR